MQSLEQDIHNPQSLKSRPSWPRSWTNPPLLSINRKPAVQVPCGLMVSCRKYCYLNGLRILVASKAATDYFRKIFATHGGKPTSARLLPKAVIFHFFPFKSCFMTNVNAYGRPFAFLAVLGLTAGTLLAGCCDKHKDDNSPDSSVCATAATVVNQAGVGLVLQLANGSYVVPSGELWTNFKATAGEAVTVGYSSKKGEHCGSGSSSNGQTVVLGCITAATTDTTSPN